MRKIAPLKRVVKTTEIAYCEVNFKDGVLQSAPVKHLNIPGKLSLRDINKALKELSAQNEHANYKLLSSDIVDKEYFMDVDLFVRASSLNEEALEAAIEWAESNEELNFIANNEETSNPDPLPFD